MDNGSLLLLCCVFVSLPAIENGKTDTEGYSKIGLQEACCRQQDQKYVRTLPGDSPCNNHIVQVMKAQNLIGRYSPIRVVTSRVTLLLTFKQTTIFKGSRGSS